MSASPALRERAIDFSHTCRDGCRKMAGFQQEVQDWARGAMLPGPLLALLLNEQPFKEGERLLAPSSPASVVPLRA